MGAPKGVVSVALILFIWSLLTYLVRCWVKRRAWAHDDSAVSVALLFVLLHVIFILRAADHGFPLPWSQLDMHDRLQACKMLYTAQIFYVLALGSARMSSSLFTARLTMDPRNSFIVTCIIIGCGVWTIASTLVIALRGDLTEPWLTLDGSNTMYIRWMGTEITGGFIELTLWALSVYFIARLNMSISRKVHLSLIFGCRLIILPFTVLRLLDLAPALDIDEELPSIAANIYTELAVNAALITSVVTCAKAFLRAFEPGVTTQAARANELSGGIKNSRGDTYYMLSATRFNTDNNTSVVDSHLSELETRQSATNPQSSFRPGHKSRATVESQGGIKVQGQDSSQMTISMTKEYDVAIYESGVRLRNEEA